MNETMPVGMTREQLMQILMGQQQNPMQNNPMTQGQMLGQNPPQGFSLTENDSLRGVLGGIGREGGGLIGQGFGALFGNDQGMVDFGGGNQFQSGRGFQQQAQGAYQPNMSPPMAEGLNFGALFNSLFGA
jgi:hypothetical protein